MAATVEPVELRAASLEASLQAALDVEDVFPTRTKPIELDGKPYNVRAIPAVYLEKIAPLIERAEREELGAVAELAVLITYWCLMRPGGGSVFSQQHMPGLRQRPLEDLQPVMELAFEVSGMGDAPAGN